MVEGNLLAKRILVKLLPNWASADNPDGPTVFYRTDSDDSGALQVSLPAEYTGGPIPNPSAHDLVELAQEHGRRHEVGELVESLSGPCSLGAYGSAVFRSTDYPRIQFWYLSNGQDFVLATHVCTVEPDAAEVAEAQAIVGIAGLTE